MRTRRAVTAALFALAPPAAATGDEAWVRVRSPYFDVFSDGTEPQARAVAKGLERFRHLLWQLVPGRSAPQERTVVLAFQGQAGFRELVPVYRGRTREVDGFFQGGSETSYIVVNLGSGRANALEPVYHEYAHLFLNRILPAQPAWVAEGLAEMYSNWEVADGELRLGRPRPEYLNLLGTRRPIPLEALLRAGYSSDLYNEAEGDGVFYAQSWALAHYLALGGPDRRRDVIGEYLSRIVEGLPPEAAFRLTIGDDPAAADKRLAAYVASPPTGLLRFRLASLDVDAPLEAGVAPAAEVHQRMGDLLLHSGNTRAARRRLEQSLAAAPGSPATLESLAQLALRELRWDDARRHLQAVFAAAPDSPAALFRQAELRVREAAQRGQPLSEADEADVVAALERAVARAPELADAVELLARLRPQPLVARIALLEAAAAREPSRVELGITLANLHIKRDDLPAASRVLARARDAAREEPMRFLCEHLLGRVARVTAATQQLTGVLASLECRADGGLDFLVRGGGQPLRLRADSPSGVFLYRPDGQPLETSFTCGPQDIPVRVFYRRLRPDEGGRGDGALLSLTFLRDP